MKFFDKVKATWYFWKNYGNSLEISKNLPIEKPDYVQDLSDDNIILTEESKDISVIHSMKQSSSFDINIPAHEPRKDSSVFIKTRKCLIDELDTPCWVCGSKENRQVHHSIIEESMQNAVDWSKVKLDHPNFPHWDLIDQNNPDTFVHFVDAEYQMIVLCQGHHTGTGKVDDKKGIHYLPYPIFLMQKYVKDGFKLFND